MPIATGARRRPGRARRPPLVVNSGLVGSSLSLILARCCASMASSRSEASTTRSEPYVGALGSTSPSSARCTWRRTAVERVGRRRSSICRPAISPSRGPANAGQGDERPEPRRRRRHEGSELVDRRSRGSVTPSLGSLTSTRSRTAARSASGRCRPWSGSTPARARHLPGLDPVLDVAAPQLRHWHLGRGGRGRARVMFLRVFHSQTWRCARLHSRWRRPPGQAVGRPTGR